MKILIACEESQAVCIKMRRLGHEAYSCDIEPYSGGHMEWHIQQDVIPLLNGRCNFKTCDGQMHGIDDKWDIIIAFPPCTYLTAAGAVRLFNHDGSIKNDSRLEKGILAAHFFNQFLNADCSKIAVENPVPLKCFNLPSYTQIIEPYLFGDPWKKKTCLWLKGLPLLRPTNIVKPDGLWVGSTSARRDPAIKQKYKLSSNRDPKVRAKTFPGVADAMAGQWAGNIHNMTENWKCV